MISIIVPVFNSEKYISRCIESIIKQTYTDWELILIDDGSTDCSYSLCVEYLKIDARISVYKQENHGASKARQHGWSMAKGEWITFVDSDDTLPYDALKLLVSATDSSTDIIVGWLDNCFEPKENILSIDEYRKRNIVRGRIHVGPVAHLYRCSIFSKEVFDIPRSIYMGEDMLMNIRLSFKTDRHVKVVNQIVYNYFIENPLNTTNSFKYNIQYEELLHKYRLLSIPNAYHTKYINEMITIRMYSLIQYITQNPLNTKWKHTLFFKDLIKDINSTGYKLNKSTFLLIKANNLILRLFLIQYRKLVKKILTHNKKYD